MAISFVANALGGTTTTTSFSITLPTTAAGDILICEFAHRGTGNGTVAGTSVTTGGLTWTLKHSQLFGASAFSGKTYWTRATGNHTGQTVTGSSLTNSCAAIVTIYRGALASGDPLADATIVGEQNISGDETQAEIVVATALAWTVLVVANSPDVAVTSTFNAFTLTSRAERLSTGGTDSSIIHASRQQTSAGGCGAFTWAQTNGASGSWAYAIKPAAAGGVTVTPGIVALVLATFAAVVTATANVTVTPSTKALTLSTFAPTVTASDHKIVVPGTASLSLATFAPTVTASNHKIVTPTTATLTTATFAPVVSTSDHKVVTPTTAALVTATFAPTVVATAHQTVTPTTAALVLTTFEPTVTGGAGITVTPATVALTLSTFAPNVATTAHQTVTPGTAALVLDTFAPIVVGGQGLIITPDTAVLTLTTFEATVTATRTVMFASRIAGGRLRI